MAKKRKMKMEFRYYQMQDGIPILALLGEKWVQSRVFPFVSAAIDL